VFCIILVSSNQLHSCGGIIVVIFRFAAFLYVPDAMTLRIVA